jgi:hypothetical protein
MKAATSEIGTYTNENTPRPDGVKFGRRPAQPANVPRD